MSCFRQPPALDERHISVGGRVHNNCIGRAQRIAARHVDKGAPPKCQICVPNSLGPRPSRDTAIEAAVPLFSRRPRTRLPADILAQLEQLGRASYDPSNHEAPWQLTVAMYQLAQQDRDGLLAELAAATLPAGGWPVYGAMKLIMDILDPKLDQPDFNAIALAGLQFLRSNGVPPNRLSPNEMDLWRRLRTDDAPWLVGRPLPLDRLTPLQPGEVRRVAQVFPGPSSNVIYVKQVAPDSCVAVIDGEWSEEDPRRVQNEWYTAQSLHELYTRIGEAFQTPCYWADPELEPYFPLPPSTL